METLQYNTKRTQLIIPEYGRHVQLMINQIMETQDREDRNKMAKAVIGIMGNMNPHLRDVPDFQHKLWDQLFIMSNFELDVDDDAKTEALSDGLLIIRFMFGLDETSLITDAVGLNATRDSSDEIIDYLSANSEKLDIDQNGQIDALTDGILILRDLFGITGETLIIGALAENATRINSQEISDYLKTIKDSDNDGVLEYEMCVMIIAPMPMYDDTQFVDDFSDATEYLSLIHI